MAKNCVFPAANIQNLTQCRLDYLTLEGISLKKLHEGVRGRGAEELIETFPSTYDTIHLIDLILGTHKGHLCNFN